MFEKEAEEYKDTYFGFADERISEVQDFEGNYIDISERIMKTFIDGAEFGYNKANEWHYVKEGLPQDNKYVLIYTDLNNCYVAKKVENHFMSKGWGFIPMSTVIAWKEIVLPKLPQERLNNGPGTVHEIEYRA